MHSLVFLYTIQFCAILSYVLLLFSCLVVSDSSRSHGLQYARLPCPSPSPRACSNACTLSQWGHPTISSSVVPSMFPSIRIFSNELTLHLRWPKYWSFSLSISPSNEYSESISFRIDWFDLLAVQGAHNSLLQHHSSKASILWHSAFFMVQLSHPHMTTWKTITLTVWTFVSQVMFLLFSTLSVFVITSIQVLCSFLNWIL